jgi:hypothetical protein
VRRVRALMASRDGVVVRVDVPCDGGVSPNRKIPLVTAEIRLFWPDKATTVEIMDALTGAVTQAMEEALMKFNEGPQHRCTSGRADGYLERRDG